jgi:hypothetical protein
MLALPVAGYQIVGRMENDQKIGPRQLAPEANLKGEMAFSICTDSEEQIDNFYMVAYLS